MRLLLEAYYEPQFSPHSYGFRPNRGCHTALNAVYKWGGVNWFIEGDIKGCFDNIDHKILLSIMREYIHDNRFLRLTENLLKAGYLENWTYKPSLSGTPQGGILSPLLSNIYLDRLDRFVETILIPQYTRSGIRGRQRNREYMALQMRMLHRKKRGNLTAYKELRKELQRMPSYNVKDPNFRRLYYARYADDFLLGLTGPKEEAEGIKEQLREFLSKELTLELSAEKTLITHATTEAARFLGYEIKRYHDDTRHDQHGRRSINEGINLRVPEDAIRKRCHLYMQNGKPIHRAELLEDADFSIVSTYQSQYGGYVQYYALAHNIHLLNRLRWTMLTSLLKTLAAKHKTRVMKIVRRYKSTVQTPDGPRRCFEVKVERVDKEPLIARFGGIPLKRKPRAEIQDRLTVYAKPKRTELVKRFLADTCELCGSTENVQVHHVRKLADLKVKGRKLRPAWMQMMVMRRRKTLIVCRNCHWDIHNGKANLASNLHA